MKWLPSISIDIALIFDCAREVASKINWGMGVTFLAFDLAMTWLTGQVFPGVDLSNTAILWGVSVGNGIIFLVGYSFYYVLKNLASGNGV